MNTKYDRDIMFQLCSHQSDVTSNRKKSKHTFFEHSDTKPKSIAFHLQYLLLPCVSAFTFFIMIKQKNTRDFKSGSKLHTVREHNQARHIEQWEVEHFITDTFYECHVYQHGQIADKYKPWLFL